MKKLYLILGAILCLLPMQVKAIDAPTLKDTIILVENAPIVGNAVYFNAYSAIKKIARSDPYLQSQLSSNDIEQLAEAVAKVHYVTEVDWKLLLSIMYVESKFLYTKGDVKPYAKNKKKKVLFDYAAIGLMQVNLKYWGHIISKAGLQQQDLLNNEKGILIGALILKKNIEKYGWEKGIMRYNGSGPAARRYAKKVLRIYKTIA